MKVETPIIAIILASIFFLGIFTVFSQIGDTYEDAGILTPSSHLDFGLDNDTVQFEDAFNEIEKTKEDVNEISDEFSELDVSLYSVWPGIELIFKTGKLIITSAKTTDEIGKATGNVLGIDPIITNGLFIILLIIILISVLLILSGRSQ